MLNDQSKFKNGDCKEGSNEPTVRKWGRVRIPKTEDILPTRLPEKKKEKRLYLGVADKAASLMGCKSPTANCPIRAVSISDVQGGNELYEAGK